MQNRSDLAAARAKLAHEAEAARLRRLAPSANDTRENREALYNAAKDGKTEDVQRYISMGVDVDGHKSPGNATALSEAAYKGHVAVVELLVAANAQVNLVDNGNCTALNAAAGGEGGASPQLYLDVVRVLLNAGAQVDLAGYEGTTPLYWAARHGHLDVVRALLNAGADKTIADDYGEKPIDVVCNGTGNEQHKDAIVALLR